MKADQSQDSGLELGEELYSRAMPGELDSYIGGILIKIGISNHKVEQFSVLL